MKNLLILLVAACMTLLACQQAEETMKTPEGFDIEYVKGPSDTLAQPGDFATFYFRVSNLDSMLTPAQIQQIEVPERTNQQASIANFLLMLGKGDSAMISIPFDSLPPQTQSQIAENSALVYHIGMSELVDSTAYAALKEQEYQQKIASTMANAGFNVDSLVQEKLQAYKSGNLENLKASNSGLEYIILDEGTGTPVGMGDTVDVNYYGVLKDNGRMFDNSYIRNQAFSLPVGAGQVIKGWDEGLQFLSYGGSGILFIPSNLAYGPQAAGAIEPNSDLVFYVNVLEKE